MNQRTVIRMIRYRLPRTLCTPDADVTIINTVICGINMVFATNIYFYHYDLYSPMMKYDQQTQNGNSL